MEQTLIQKKEEDDGNIREEKSNRIQNNEPSDLSILTPEREKRLKEIREMNFFSRNFRALQFGSMRGVIVMFLRLTLGAGVFTLPFYVSKFGYIVGPILILLAGYVSMQSFFEIAEASEDSGKNNYFELIEHYLGRKTMQVFKVTYFLDISSSPICAMIVIYSLMKLILGMTGLADPAWIKNVQKGEWDEDLFEVKIVRGCFFFLFYWLSVSFLLKKNLFFLQKVNVLIIGALVSLLVYTLLELPFFGNAYKGKITRTAFMPVDKTWLENIFALLMAYYAQPFLFSLKEQLLLPTVDRMKKVARNTIIIEAVVFSVLGFTGYWCLGNEYTTDLIYQRVMYPGKNMFSERVFQLMLIFFFLCVMLGLAIFNPTIRDYFYDVLHLDRKNKTVYYVISLVPFAVYSIFCFIKPDIVFILNVSGVSFSNFNGLIIPALMKAKINHRNQRWRQFYWCVFKLAVFIIFGLIGFCFIVAGMISPSN